MDVSRNFFLRAYYCHPLGILPIHPGMAGYNPAAIPPIIISA